MKTRIYLLALAFCILLVTSGCSRLLQVEKLELEPRLTQIEVGESIELKAFLTYKDGSKGEAYYIPDWSCSDYTILGWHQIDYPYAMIGKRSGEVTVTAFVGKYQASATIVVTEEDAPTLPTELQCEIGNITSDSATISWKTTNPELGQIELGLDSSYGTVIAEEGNELLTEHKVNLTGLSPNTVYHCRITSRDANGQERVSRNWSFQTQYLAFAVTEQCNQPALNPITNKVYGISLFKPQLQVLDLTHKTETKIPFSENIAAFALAPERNSIFILFYNHNKITEYSLDGFTKIQEIPWTVTSVQHSPYHNHLYYMKNQLYVVDGGEVPELWIVDLNEPVPATVYIPEISKIGALTVGVDTQDLYFWSQEGWTNLTKESKVYHYSNVLDGQYKLIDQSSLKFPDFLQQNLTDPIFYLADKAKVLCKKYMFDSKDLTRVLHIFPEEILAVNSEHTYVATQHFVFDLETYERVADIKPENQLPPFFDNAGNVYFQANYYKIQYIHLP